jgi:hypothetical protein
MIKLVYSPDIDERNIKAYRFEIEKLELSKEPKTEDAGK